MSIMPMGSSNSTLSNTNGLLAPVKSENHSCMRLLRHDIAELAPVQKIFYETSVCLRCNEFKKNFSLKNEEASQKNLWKLLTITSEEQSTLNLELIKKAMFKTNGYLNRLSSVESWEEWLENRTALGRVIDLYDDYVFGGAQLSSIESRLDEKTVQEANRISTEVLEEIRNQQAHVSLSPLAENPEGFIHSLFSRIDSFLTFPGAESKPIGKRIKNNFKKTGRILKDTGDAMVKGEDITEIAAENAKRELKKGIEQADAILKEIEERELKYFESVKKGSSLVLKHYGAGLETLYRIATLEYKLNPKAFQEELERGRKNFRNEMARAPKEIQLVNEAIRGMIEDDPQGTAILLASFISDAYAPGTGQLIRQAYTVHQLAKSGANPNAIVKNILEGNAEQILTTMVTAYAPEYTSLVEGAAQVKKARDLYQDNRDLIEGAMQGDKNAQGLLAQKLALLHPELSDKFEAFGINPLDLVALQNGDMSAARSLALAGMRMSVASMVERVQAIPEEDDALPEEDNVLPEEGHENDKDSDLDDSVEIVSHLNEAEDFIKEQLELQDDFISPPHVSQDNKQKKSNLPPNDSDKIPSQKGEGKKVRDKIAEKFKDEAIDRVIDQKEALRSKLLKRGIGAAKGAYDLYDDAESTIIEKALQLMAQGADVVLNGKGKIASKLGGPINILVELFSSETLGEGADFKGEDLCKHLGFNSCAEYNQWLTAEKPRPTHKK